MILAHHAGEDTLLMLAASGAGTVSVMFAMVRARIERFVDRIRNMVKVLWRRA